MMATIGSSVQPMQVCGNYQGQTLTYEYKEFDDEHFTYPKCQYKGYVLIINNEEFTHEPARKNHRRGSNFDTEGFRNVLLNIGIRGEHIRMEANKTAKEMEKILHDVSKKDFADFGCLVVAVFSFGEDFIVYGTDDRLSYKQLMSPFYHKAAPSLEDKPKMFIIQTESLTRTLTHDALPPVLVSNDITEPDFLLMYSLEEAEIAWKTGSRGTWFIQSLIEVLRLDGRRLDMMSVLTRVNYLIRQCYESHVTHSASQASCPFIRSTLSKTFNLSYHDD